MKSRICFQREFYVFGALHCPCIRLLNFLKRHQLILHDTLGFFAIHDRFLNDIFRFGSQNYFFNESVGFFGFTQFVRRCVAVFFIGIFRFFKSRIARVLRFWSTSLCFHRGGFIF